MRVTFSNEGGALFIRSPLELGTEIDNIAHPPTSSTGNRARKYSECTLTTAKRGTGVIML